MLYCVNANPCVLNSIFLSAVEVKSLKKLFDGGGGSGFLCCITKHTVDEILA